MAATALHGTILLRSGRPSDLEEMNRLDSVCFQPPFRFTPSVMRRFVQEPGAITLVAESLDGGFAGFILIQVNGENDSRHGYVVTLDVAPEFRRRGLARQLLEAAETAAESEGAREMVLHVWTANLPAICFYESAGYTRKKLHRDLYAPGFDAYDYSKLLSGVSGTT